MINQHQTTTPLTPFNDTAPVAPEVEITFQKKERLIAGYLAAFAVVYYRYQAERSTAAIQATLHVETANSVFPLATVSLEISDTLTLEAVAAEAANQVTMALAGIAEELGALISRCRISFLGPETPTNDDLWCVTLSLPETDEAVSLGFTCAEKHAAHRVASYTPAHLQAVHDQLLRRPSVTVGTVFFLHEEEVAQLREFSAGPLALPETAPDGLILHELFEETARTYPDHVAIHWQGADLSYRQLDEQADRLAHQLRQQGVLAGDFVGLLMTKSPELYVGMLATLKAGAAYVPLDLSFPAERITYILSDCGAKALLINSSLTVDLAGWAGVVVNLATPVPASFAGPALPTVGPDAVAYIIYTSGTTGMPKGVLIPHRSICHLVKAEQALFAVGPQDRILQGFSVAFDASLEEIWLAFGSGAALVPAPEETMKTPDALPDFLSGNNVTVFSTVPTLLSLLEGVLPALRLLILGGEVCPPELLEKWARSDRRVVNTYGPTESTVVTTSDDYVPGQKLTIGRPIPGYVVVLLDQLGQMLPLGAAGEICVGGPALAIGYVNQPALSASKFITVTELPTGFAGRLYRTGDLGRFETDGAIDFLGRIDTQVKIRGFRVELSEIESQLLQWPGIRNAAVALKEGADGVKKLIAYLVTDNNQPVDDKAVRDFLRSRLAPYMIPAALVTLPAFPLLTSGKVNRKALPYPVTGETPTSRELLLPVTADEVAIYAAWKKRFDTDAISITDDFFDIGGNSLLASLIISELRQLPQFQGLSVKNMYTCRTIQALAECALVVPAASATPGAETERPLPRLSPATRLATAALQVLAVGLFYFIPMVLLTLSIVVRARIADWSVPAIIGVVIVAVTAYVPVACLFVVLAKWLVIGRFKAGEYPLWGFYYVRFWFVKKLVEASPTILLSATPFLNTYYRLLGANIGKQVYIGSTRFMSFDLITIEDGASIAREACMLGYRIEKNRLIIGSIYVGQNAYVGLRSVLEGDTRLGHDAVLDDLSVLPAGQQIPAQEEWIGSPAQRVRGVDLPEYPRPVVPSLFLRTGYLAAQGTAIMAMLLVPTVATVPVLGCFYECIEHIGFVPSLLVLIPLSALYVVILGGLLALIKRFVAGRQLAGTMPLDSWGYVRHWVADTVMALSLSILKPLYSTIYTPFWLRLLGAKIGKRAEVSTLNHISADHLTVGAGAFLADSVSIGAPRVQRGMLTVAHTVIGAKTFIGNSAVLAGGTTLGTGNLIGALSTAPSETPADNTSWVGSPSFLLPNRPQSQSFSDELTFSPPTRLVVGRGIMEFFKVTLPFTFVTATLAILYEYCAWHLPRLSFWMTALHATAVFAGLIFAFSLFTAVLKWVLIGRYRPTEKPLWSSYVWRNELINSLCESYVYLYWVAPLLGTPFGTSFFLLMGCRFGHGVYLDTTEITEFDLVWVADKAVLNNSCTIQTHLFEDRVMKMSTLRIGREATVGTSSVVLYDSVIGPGATLKSLSLLMKGEVLPANTRWQGIPSSFIP